MRTPDEVAAMLRPKGLGWGVRRIAAELGCSHMTVRRYLEAGGWTPAQLPRRSKALDGLEMWLAERFRQHRGNADVVRQDLERELGIRASLRTVERAVAHLRQEMTAAAKATVRFETPPGHQLQVDFGELRIPVDAEERGRVYLFVATLGYSRRVYGAAPGLCRTGMPKCQVCGLRASGWQTRHERREIQRKNVPNTNPEAAFRRDTGALPCEVQLSEESNALEHLA